MKKEIRFKADLERLEKINEVIRTQKDKMDHPFFHDPCIAIGHALENVRVNGWQRKVGFIDIKKDYDSMVADYKEYTEIILPKIKEALEKMGDVLSGYEICPACKGKQGDKYEGNYNWHDCGKCDGYGVIKKVNQ